MCRINETHTKDLSRIGELFQAQNEFISRLTWLELKLNVENNAFGTDVAPSNFGFEWRLEGLGVAIDEINHMIQNVVNNLIEWINLRWERCKLLMSIVVTLAPHEAGRVNQIITRFKVYCALSGSLHTFKANRFLKRFWRIWGGAKSLLHYMPIFCFDNNGHKHDLTLLKVLQNIVRDEHVQHFVYEMV